MKQIKFSGTLITVFVATLAYASAAQAQQNHSFVSQTGDNTNNCTVVNPCRTFAGAQTKTDPRGVITALDTGLYGSITITKSLTIQAVPGVTATLNPNLKAGGNGNSVTVEAGPSDVVVIRNLSMIATDGGTNGIRINTAGSVHVEACVIAGFRGQGAAGVYSRIEETFFLHDTVVRNNALGVFVGGGTIDHCRIEHNTDVGVLLQLGQTRVTITDSVAAGNSIGLKMSTFQGLSMLLEVERCIVSNNSVAGIEMSGAVEFGGGSVLVSNSTVTNNGIGFSNQTSSNPNFSNTSFRSRGNNTVYGNGQDIVGPITTINGN